MFFNEPNRLPTEMIFQILQWLPLKDAVSLLRASKDMHETINNDRFWQEQGAENFQDFVTRLNELPPYFQGLVLNSKYSLKFCEDFCNEYLTQRFLRHMSNPMPVIRKMLPEYAKLPQDFDYDGFNTTQALNFCIAFLEKLMSPNQMTLLGEPKTVALITTSNGIKALRHGLITPEEIATAKESLDNLIERKIAQFQADQIDAPPSKKPRL